MECGIAEASSFELLAFRSGAGAGGTGPISSWAGRGGMAGFMPGRGEEPFLKRSESTSIFQPEDLTACSAIGFARMMKGAGAGAGFRVEGVGCSGGAGTGDGNGGTGTEALPFAICSLLF